MLGGVAFSVESVIHSSMSAQVSSCGRGLLHPHKRMSSGPGACGVLASKEDEDISGWLFHVYLQHGFQTRLEVVLCGVR